ncbi:DUF4836 family protein [Chitinophaga sp. Mgbs1]|uniref:DUF4836 family protein n=1 Tax=Chitinophaga solisilvae TaxID=1233460 RepID=A0A3S1CZN3_9BACT|nr:DUF4836 family protein [Chitinophaga solisilvae]
MKRTISKVLLAAVSAAVFLSSCSKTPDESKHIPKNAGIVVDLNAKQLTQKLVTNGITMDKFFSAMQSEDSSSKTMKEWKELENSGLDLKSHFFVSFVFQGQPSEHKSYLSMTGSLQDAAKFEAYLKKEKKDFSLKTEKDFKYIWEEDKHALVAWTNSTVLYISPVDPSDLNKYAPAGTPGLPGTDDEPSIEDANPAAIDSAAATPVALLATADDAEVKTWVAEADHLFHLKKEETAGALEPFAKLLKEGADMGVFVNPEAIYNSGQLTMIPANFKKLMEGSFYTASINFEKGKVVANGIQYMGKEMAAIFKKSGKKEIDLDMLKKYPSSDVTGFLSYALDFQMIGEIIKSTGMDGLVNMFLSSKSGLTMDDLLNAFEGQLVYIASDFSVVKKESPYFPGEFKDEPTAKWIFSLKVGKKEAFEKVMNSPMLKEVFQKEGDRYVLANPALAANAPAMSITDKMITLGSDSVLLQQYLGGKGAIKLPEGVESKVKGSMIGGYIDLEKITKNIPLDKQEEEEKTIITKVQALLKDATLVSKPDGDKIRTEAVMNLKNKDENSLVQFFNFATEAAKVMEAKKARSKAIEDSLFATPVDTVVAEPVH